jgi:hypothetical protein
MTESAVRDLMRQAMAGHEPPMGPVLGQAILAARRTRRQRLAASVGAVTLIVACVAVGLSAAGVPDHGLQRHGLSITQVVFVRPALPDLSFIRNGPITSQSVGQLLVAELPPGAGYSQVEANANANTPGTTGRTASAWLTEVTTAIGSGPVQAVMTAAGTTDAQLGCPPGVGQGLCKTYSLQGGVKVVEQYASARLSTSPRHLLSFQVQVFRPRVAVVRLSESNITAGGGALSVGMPLTATQLLAAAVDPRWQFYATKPAADGTGGGHGMMT